MVLGLCSADGDVIQYCLKQAVFQVRGDLVAAMPIVHGKRSTAVVIAKHALYVHFVFVVCRNAPVGSAISYNSERSIYLAASPRLNSLRQCGSLYGIEQRRLSLLCHASCLVPDLGEELGHCSPPSASAPISSAIRTSTCSLQYSCVVSCILPTLAGCAFVCERRIYLNSFYRFSMSNLLRPPIILIGGRVDLN